MAEDAMDNTSDRNGTSFTNKEMWVRVDGKLDAVLAKQNHYDVELALLKERVAGVERTEASSVAASSASRETLEKQLDDAAALMVTEVQNLKDGQVTLNTALKWATATVIGASVIIDGAIRFFQH
jgi:hypothetical protein